MEGRDKRKLAVHMPMPLQNAKRCKSDGEDGDCSNTWCSSSSEFSIAADSSNFEQCVSPLSFMFYEQGEWKKFLRETSAALGLAFQAHHSSVEFSLCGSRYLLSFTRMLQLNLVTGFCRSIAWIDANGKSFYPSKCMEGYGIHLLQLVKHPKRCARNIDLLQRGIISLGAQSIKSGNAVALGSPDLTCQQEVVDVEVSQFSVANKITRTSKSSALADLEVSDNDCGDQDISLDSSSTSSTIVSSDLTSDVTSNLQNVGHTAAHSSRVFPLLQDKLVRLKDTDAEFHEVMKKFMAGLSVLANHTTITGISKDCHRNTTGQVRYQAFKQHEKITKTMRGDANVRYAWYGTSKQGVSSVVLHGFGQPKTPKDGAMYGVGIYLAPENLSNVSAVYSDVDENGEQHLVLCRVIMGNMEQVCRGSVQFHPGSEDFDGGVDDLCNPKQYIVWSTHMNTHILPEYIVSFKIAAPWQGIIAALRGKRKVCRKPIQFDCQHTGPVKVKDEVLCTETTPRCSYSPPRSPWMSIELLFLLMKSSLPVESMVALQRHYVDLKDGRLSSSDFIHNVRLIAGDHLVSSSIKSMQTHVLGAVALRSLLASGTYRMVDSSRIV